mmetsp:Transcript_9780/g.12390  ORF Transcript_9780/g.12390 Transcript_9780/m.12390 type:complete len:95 (-) Transcript_9780:7-291(-)
MVILINLMPSITTKRNEIYFNPNYVSSKFHTKVIHDYYNFDYLTHCNSLNQFTVYSSNDFIIEFDTIMNVGNSHENILCDESPRLLCHSLKRCT